MRIIVKILLYRVNIFDRFLVFRVVVVFGLFIYLFFFYYLVLNLVMIFVFIIFSMLIKYEIYEKVL